MPPDQSMDQAAKQPFSFMTDKSFCAILIAVYPDLMHRFINNGYRLQTGEQAGYFVKDALGSDQRKDEEHGITVDFGRFRFGQNNQPL